MAGQYDVPFVSEALQLHGAFAIAAGARIQGITIQFEHGEIVLAL
jgi:hypothetical protein